MQVDTLHTFPPFLLMCSYSPERPHLQTFYQEAPKGYAKASPPDQRTQVHGHLPEAAHLLLALQGVYLVRGSLTSFILRVPISDRESSLVSAPGMEIYIFVQTSVILFKAEVLVRSSFWISINYSVFRFLQWLGILYLLAVRIQG